MRKAIDGASRRRLYLFRHGAVDYIDANGDWVADPDLVDLNERGNTIVLITHDAHVASFARRRLDFCDGRIQSDHRSARA